MPLDLPQVIQSLLTRVQSLAANASANEAAYLAKTIEAVSGPNTLAELQALSDSQRAALNSSTQAQLLQIEQAGAQLVSQANAKLQEIQQSISSVTAAYPFTLAASNITYDSANRISSLSEGNKVTDQISYNRSGQISAFRERITLNQQTTTRLYSVSYDAAGRITQISFQ